MTETSGDPHPFGGDGPVTFASLSFSRHWFGYSARASSVSADVHPAEHEEEDDWAYVHTASGQRAFRLRTHKEVAAFRAALLKAGAGE